MKNTYLLIIIILFTNCTNPTKSKTKESPILWETFYEVEDFEHSLPNYFEKDSSLFLSRNKGLNKYDAISGNLIWRKEYNSTLWNFVNEIYVDENYVYATPSNGLFVFDREGNIKFQQDGHIRGGSTRSLLTDDLFYLSFEFELKMFDTSSLTFVDNFSIENKVITNFTIDKNSIYLSLKGRNKETKEGATGGLYAIDLTSKEILWNLDVEPDTQGKYWQLSGFNHASIVYENKVINAANAETTGIFNMYCLDADSGKILWQKEGMGIRQKSPMKDNFMYVFINQNVLAIDVNNGDVLWEKFIYGANSSAIYVYKDYLYFVNNTIQVMDPQNGELLYTYDLHHGITKESINFGDDKVFVNGYDRLYALKAYHALND